MKQRLMRAGIGVSISVFVVFLLQMVFIPFVQGTISLGNKYDASMKDDPFILGEYYFNNDDNPEGPYDLKKARMYYEQVILDDPQKNALVWHQLGRIDFLEGDYDAALYKFNKQIKYFGDTVPNVYYMIGLTYGYKARQTKNVSDWEKGEKAFRTFLSYDPENPWARTDLSWIYFAQGKYREMIPVLYQGLVSHPHHPWLLNMYGLALRNLGNEEEAKTYFLKADEEASQLTPEDWGSAYPGNSPQFWEDGLAEFQSVVNFNTRLE